MEIAQILGPIFLLIGAGWVLRRVGIADDRWVHYLNLYAYYAALPALILISFWQINWRQPEVYAPLGFNLLLLAGLLVAAYVILAFLKVPPKMKAGIFLCLAVGNTVYMGFPIVGGAVPQGEFSTVIAVASFHLVVGLAVSVAAVGRWANKSKHGRRYLSDFVRNPFVPAMVLGVLLSFFRSESSVVRTVQSPLLMLGQTASPVALFALGALLHGKFLRHHFRAAFLVSVIKLLLFPCLALLAAWSAGQSAASTKISALVLAMPAAASTFVIAEKFKLDKDFVANIVLVSTALSLASVAVWLVWI